MDVDKRHEAKCPTCIYSLKWGLTVNDIVPSELEQFIPTIDLDDFLKTYKIKDVDFDSLTIEQSYSIRLEWLKQQRLLRSDKIETFWMTIQDTEHCIQLFRHNVGLVSWCYHKEEDTTEDMAFEIKIWRKRTVDLVILFPNDSEDIKQINKINAKQEKYGIYITKNAHGKIITTINNKQVFCYKQKTLLDDKCTI